jgi:hypothetical protein
MTKQATHATRERRGHEGEEPSNERVEVSSSCACAPGHEKAPAEDEAWPELPSRKRLGVGLRGGDGEGEAEAEQRGEERRPEASRDGHLHLAGARDGGVGDEVAHAVAPREHGEPQQRRGHA